jgi:tetratricopeptide (TPR) repeat protein
MPRSLIIAIGLTVAAAAAHAQTTPATSVPAPESDRVELSPLQQVQKLIGAGQLKQALERADAHLAKNPRDAQMRFVRGVILTEMKDTGAARDVFERLTEDFPELPEPYNNLAVLYASQGAYDKARNSLEMAIRTHPSYATAHENPGDIYAKMASQAYDKALQLDSSNAAAKNKLSLVRELVGGPAPAVAVTKPPAVVAQKEPAEKKPAPAKPEPVADPTADILEAVNGWAAAWSKKDVDGYLGHYAKNFDPPGGQSRADWEKTRRARIEAPKEISVEIASPKVTMQGSDTALVSFRQTYRSDRFNGTSSKTLTMTKSDGRWLIREEKGG